MATIIVNDPGANQDIYTNLLSAFTAAVDGDIVSVPYNQTYIMTNTINVTKKVSFIGNGIGNTIIKRSEASSDSNIESWGTMVSFTRPSTTVSGVTYNDDRPCGIVVSGFTFKSRIPSAYDDGHDGLSLALDQGITFYYCNDFKIYGCRFEYFGNGGLEINHRDYLARGLVYNCQFFMNVKATGETALGYGYGITVYGEGKDWYSNVKFGTGDMIFIEDCTFDYHRHSIASAGGSRHVVRNNTLRFNLISPPYSHCIDTHESRGFVGSNGKYQQSRNSYGSRIIEVYNNSIINSTRTTGGTPMGNGCPDNYIEERAIGITSGAAVVFNNACAGYRFMIGMHSSDAESSGVYPWKQQPGWISGRRKGSGHTGTDTVNDADDLHYWNNSFTAYTLTGGGSCQLFYNYDAGGGNIGTMFALEREYHPTAKPGYLPFPYPHPNR